MAALLAFPAAPASSAAVDKASLKSQEAASALLRNRFDLAIAAYDEALREGSLPPVRQASLYSDRGVAKWRSSRQNEALADFGKAISLNPQYAASYNNRGILLLELGKPEEALRDLDKAISIAPGFGPAYNNRANALHALNRVEDAGSDFRKAMELMPSNAAPFNGRGMTETALGRDFTAVRYLNRALGLNAQYSQAYRNRALALLGLRKSDEAIQDLDKVIALSPNDPMLYVKRGEANAAEKRLPFAFRDFSKALELNPKNVDALIGRGRQNIERKRNDLAIEDLDQAIDLNASNAKAYYLRGVARYASGDGEKGGQDLDKAIELNPDFADAYRTRGSQREKAGQRDNAIADLKKALELDPLSREIRDAYKAATGETADAVVKPILPAVAGWEIFNAGKGRFVASNERYPKLQVQLEMAGQNEPEIIEWTQLKDALAGLGLLRYKAGDKNGTSFENVAIIDLYRNQVVSEEPYIAGGQKAKWTWTGASVTITDPDGLSSTYELRKTAPIQSASQKRRNDDGLDSLFGSRRDRGYRGGRGQGLFGWLFQ